MLDKDQTLQALLRLKRHEQPPPEYFEKFLVDFHRCQRAEILQRPLWKIVLDRLEAFFGTPATGQLQYAGATAALVVVCGLAALHTFNPTRPAQTLTAHSRTASERSTPLQHVMALDSRNSTIFDFPAQAVDPRLQPAASPRYIIDARPVSYEPTFSF